MEEPYEEPEEECEHPAHCVTIEIVEDEETGKSVFIYTCGYCGVTW